jgi:hypothetical protein
MRNTPITLLLAAAFSLNAGAVSPGQAPILQERANKAAAIETATKALADTDAKYTAILGKGWLERLQQSDRSEGEEIVDAYLAGLRFDYPWATINAAAAEKLHAHLLAKQTLTQDDLKIVRTAFGPRGVPALQPRMAELLALMPGPRTFDYYDLKYRCIMAASKNVSEWTLLVTPAEWLDLSTGEYDAATYGLLRDNMLRIVTKAMVEKRGAADQDTDGPAFDAAMAPVVAALGSPLFEGLQEATKGLGLDLAAPDYVDTVTRANRLAASIERRTVSENDARKAIGTLMFVKGVTGYNEWKNTRAATP